MKVALAYCPRTGGGPAARALWRLTDQFHRIYPTPPAGSLSCGNLTDLMRFGSLRPLQPLAYEPSVTGHFLLWRMMRFLGPEVSHRYHWLTVLRDPVDWAVSLFNQAHRLSRDPLAPQFGWPVEHRFEDWLASVEPNVQTAFAPEQTAKAALAFARSNRVDLVPLPHVGPYMDSLYRREGVPPLPLPVSAPRQPSPPSMRREELSDKDVQRVRSRLNEDVRLYEQACEGFGVDNGGAPAVNGVVVHTPKAITEFAQLAGGGPVYIYGSAQTGRTILRALLDVPGIDFAGFLDSRASSMVGRYPVHHVEAVPVAALHQATIIIGTVSYGPVIQRLMAAGATRIWDGYAVVSTRLYDAAGRIIGEAAL